MTQPVEPSSGVNAERRAKDRRGKDRRGKDRRAGKSALPVPVGAPMTAEAAPPTGDAVFTAQVLGQTGQSFGFPATLAAHAVEIRPGQVLRRRTMVSQRRSIAQTEDHSSVFPQATSATPEDWRYCAAHNQVRAVQHRTNNVAI